MKYVKYCFLTALTFTLFSCRKSFLDVPDKTVLLRQAYVTDLKTLGDYMNGIHVYLATDFYTGMVRIYPDLVSDNINALSSAFMGNHHKWTQQANAERTVQFSGNQPNANGLWFSGYRMIRDCNFVLEQVDQYSNQDPAKADNMKGQAFALRAFAHFYLVNVFAQSWNFSADASHPGVPYITISDYTAPVERVSVSEVYENMISDLNNAIQLLPASGDPRFMNQATAKALLARVYLFKQDYQAAKNLAVEIGKTFPILSIAQGYPDNVFKFLPGTQNESLLLLPPSNPGVSGSAGEYYTFFAGYYCSFTSFFTASSGIAALLQENPADLRNAWVSPSGSAWHITKYPSNVITGFGTPSASYFESVIRSSEMFLTSAECYARINNEDSAVYYLDAIRLRANPAATGTTATGTALLDSIYKERRKELAFEGLRMFDLQRWKQPVHRADPVDPAAQDLPYPSNKAIAPIPVPDVELSGIIQNPGY